MQNMLFELASDDLEIPIRGQVLKGRALIPSLKKLSKFERLMEWFERRRKDPEMLLFMFYSGIDRGIVKDNVRLEEFIRLIRERFQDCVTGDIQLDEEHQTYSVEVRRQRYKLNIDIHLFTSPEVRELENLFSIIRDLGETPYMIQAKDGPREIASSKDLLELILATAKKGLTIQRYKGLGEMNPQQLWETTMDTEKRTLLQVNIQDSVKADDIFTVLMGDQVEPRKEFITTYALEARNIDI
jgi:DNA gyrase subunit B